MLELCFTWCSHSSQCFWNPFILFVKWLMPVSHERLAIASAFAFASLDQSKHIVKAISSFLIG